MSSKTARVDEDWYKDAFGDMYQIVYAHRTIEAAEPESHFAVEQLGLKSDDRVLDLCCGNGRHMAHLLKVTSHVTGLDYSPQLLDLAKNNLGSSVHLIRADMRNIPYTSCFDIVTSFFTSFGYFFSDDENAQVVHEVARALKPCGRFFVDYLNGSQVKKSLVPDSLREYHDYQIIETRWLSDNDGRVNKSTVVMKDDTKAHESSESVRLYSQDDMVGMLGNAGLITDRVFGNYDGSALDENQPRMIIIGHKE